VAVSNKELQSDDEPVLSSWELNVYESSLCDCSSCTHVIDSYWFSLLQRWRAADFCGTQLKELLNSCCPHQCYKPKERMKREK